MVTVGKHFCRTPLREIFLLHARTDFSQTEDTESEQDSIQLSLIVSSVCRFAHRHNLANNIVGAHQPLVLEVKVEGGRRWV
jgi:hypothetical protein